MPIDSTVLDRGISVAQQDLYDFSWCQTFVHRVEPRSTTSLSAVDFCSADIARRMLFFPRHHRTFENHAMRLTTTIALLLLPALATAQRAELFRPMPLAALHASEDPTLLALHENPAFTVIGRVDAAAQVMQARASMLALNLTPELQGEASLMRSETLEDGSVVWHGQWRGTRGCDVLKEDTYALAQAANEVTLVNHDGRISGSLHIDGQLYAIRPLRSGGHAVIAVDSIKLPPDHPVEQEASASSHVAAPPHETLQTRASDTDARVMVLFSDEAMQSLADPIGFAHLAVAETNQGYANSGVAHRLTTVAIFPAEYQDSHNIHTDLSRLREPSDGQLDWVHARRDEYGADLVALITANGGACGLGHLHANAASAFTVSLASCATGYYSFGHEIGHNYGAMHDPAAGTNTVYAYGHGYQNLPARIRTVMAHDCPGRCTRVNLWSGPHSRWNGWVMGDAHQSDNVRVLNERAATVAGFR